jgi:hypothetical protein
MNVFLFSIIANIFAALLISWLATKARSSKLPLHSESAVKFAYPKAIIFASSCALIGWLFMFVFLIAIVFLFAGVEDKLLLVVSLLSFLFMALVYLISSIQLKCVNCKKRLFVQAVERPPYSIKFKGLTGWSSIVLQVLILKSFTCMHCGQVHTLK